MARTPKLGGELPAYNTMTPKKPRKSSAQALQNTVNGLAKSGYGSKNYVQQPPMPRPAQVMSNLAAPYGSTPVKDGTIMNRPRVAGRMSDQTPRVKDGTIYPRKPMPGIPRRPTR